MEQTTKPFAGTAELPETISSKRPSPLPYCAYSKASDVNRHGVQPLPPSMPHVDFVRAHPHRSRRYCTVVAADLTPSQMLQMTPVVAASFARREPQVPTFSRRSTHPWGSWRHDTPTLRRRRPFGP